LFQTVLFGQDQEKSAARKLVQYDKWVTIESNANIRNASNNKSGGISTNFVLIGRQWNRRIITYFFQNGTPDIAGTNEQNAVRDAMAIWSNAVDLYFLEVCNQADADVSFLFAAGNHGDPIPDCEPGIGAFDGVNGTLAHNMGGPDPGNNCGVQGADIHFDEAENWTDATRANGDQPIDLVTVAAHELGHGLGLFHTTVSGSLMLANYSGSHRFLGQDDLAGIRSIYGLPQTNIPINGPVLVCTNGTFTLNNQPANTALTWSTGNPGALTINPASGVATRLSNFNGQVTVTATLASVCGNVNITRTVWVGLPQISNQIINGSPYYGFSPPTLCPGGHWLQVTTQGATGSVNWVVPSGIQSQVSPNPNRLDFYLYPFANASSTITANATNTCGTSQNATFTILKRTSGCPASFSIAAFPNPVSDELTVTTISSPDFLDAQAMFGSALKDTPPNVGRAVLLDRQGQSVSEGQLIEEKLKLNIKGLKKGSYFLHISIEDKIYKKQIIVE
jgi:hypothetical protein